jgi:hypothetical protein
MATARTQIAPVPTRPCIVTAQSLKRNPIEGAEMGSRDRHRSRIGRRWRVLAGTSAERDYLRNGPC